MNVLLVLIIGYGLYRLVTEIFGEKALKSGKPVPDDCRFTTDRQDPYGWEWHRGLGTVRADVLRSVLRNEGFCEERIDRLIGNKSIIMCDEYFLV